MIADTLTGSKSQSPALVRGNSTRAERLAESKLLPLQLRGNVETAELLIDLADRLGISEASLAFNLRCYEEGSYGFSNAFYRAVANRSGVFRGSIHYEIGQPENQADLMQCTAAACLASTGETIETTVCLASFHDEKSLDPDGVAEMWHRRPAYMLKCAAARELINLYCPEVVWLPELSVRFEDRIKNQSHNLDEYSQQHPEDDGSPAEYLEDQIRFADDLGELKSIASEIDSAQREDQISAEQAAILKQKWFDRQQQLTPD